MPGKFVSTLRRLIRDTTGQDMVEYALLAGFVAVAATATLPDMSHRLWHIFDNLEEVVEEEIEEIIPLAAGLDGASYEILVGFELTGDQLEYNRRRRR